MKSFLKRLSVFGLIPFVFLVIGYVTFDPFKVIYKYDIYGDSPVILNRDFVSTQIYINQHEKYHYNSFVFGSSRTIAFKPSAWKKYLGKDASVYSFDAAGEAFYGVHDKLQYLDKQNAKIDNALIILCRDWGFKDRSEHGGHLFKKHPDVSGNSWLAYHFKFFSSYMNSKFLLAYYNYKFTNEFKPWMAFIIFKEMMTFDPVTNEMNFPSIDNLLATNPKKYFSERDSIFYKREGEKLDTLDRIDAVQLKMFKEVKEILERKRVNYKIVASPLYDEIKFSKHDKDILVKLFGKNFYDYTGKNKFTEDKQNYYEVSHFRPRVGEAILKEIYEGEEKKAIVN